MEQAEQTAQETGRGNTAKPAQNNRIWKDVLLETALYVGVFLVTLALFLTVKPLMLVGHKGSVPQTLMAVLLACVLLFAAYMGATKRLNVRRIIFLLLLIGFILRVGYMLYTPAATRQQDTYSQRFNGHEAYAWTLFTTGKLPVTNDYQFYHPPLNALVQAGFMHFMQGLTDGLTSLFGLGDYFTEKFSYAKPSYITDNERWFLYSSCQILAVLYSFITCVVSLKILKMFSFSDKTRVLLAAFVVLFPRNMQFSGMLNNDGISFMFSITALYFALKWWKGNKSLLWILLCGGAIGLGMMAKFSSATICLPIAGIFIYEFIRTLMKKEGSLSIWKMVLQYGLFLCVCAPLALWFQVYANQRFGQELGYVFSNLNKKLYTGHHSFFERFFVAFDLSEYLGSLYCRPFEGNYNLFNYALRSSIFGEFSYWQGEGFAAVSLALGYLGSALLFVGLVWCGVLYWKQRKNPDSMIRKNPPISHQDLLFVFLWMQSQALSEIYFYIKMPYGCTMDFRYIMPIILAIALTIGYVQKTLVATENKWALALDRALTIVVAGFLISSSLFYCVCI